MLSIVLVRSDAFNSVGNIRPNNTLLSYILITKGREHSG